MFQISEKEFDNLRSQFATSSNKGGRRFRFLIIDGEIYHIGVSLKDLGKKLFAFSKLDSWFIEKII